MRFTWDDRKNRHNTTKHGVSFETAALVFEDPDHLSRLDREVEGESRWQTLGMLGESVLLVAHTVETENDEEIIRIISARKATPRERSIYAQGK